MTKIFYPTKQTPEEEKLAMVMNALNSAKGELEKIQQTIKNKSKESKELISQIGELVGEVDKLKKDILSLEKQKEEKNGALNKALDVFAETSKQNAEILLTEQERLNALRELIKTARITFDNLRAESLLDNQKQEATSANVATNLRHLEDDLKEKTRQLAKLEKTEQILTDGIKQETGKLIKLEDDLKNIGLTIGQQKTIIINNRGDIEGQRIQISNAQFELKEIDNQMALRKLAIKEADAEIKEKKNVILGLIKRENDLDTKTEKIKKYYERAGLECDI